jgi:hypothetical protein
VTALLLVLVKGAVMMDIFAVLLLIINNVGFQVLTASNMKMRAFCDIAPYNLAEVDRRFRGLHHQDLIMEAVRTSQTTVYFEETKRPHIPEGYCLQ